MFPKLLEVKALLDFNLWLKFDDGTEGTVSLDHLVNTKVFSSWKKDVKFDDVYIDPHTNALAWNDTMEISTDAQYLKLKGLTFDEWKAQQSKYAPIK